MDTWAINKDTFLKKHPNEPILRARKKKIGYTMINKRISLSDLYSGTKFSSLSIVKVNKTNAHLVGCKFVTLFARYGHVEESGVAIKQDAYLIKGPLGEVYQVSSEKFHSIWNYDKKEGIYYPVSDERSVIKVTSANNPGSIKTSYGGTHIVHEGDYLVVNGDNFYRVFGPAFAKTYTVRERS